MKRVAMNDVILRTNAIPVYGFLSVIHSMLPEGETLHHRRILDCGAGGPVPPLALFYRHGLEAWGIDTSEVQLDRARRFGEERGIPLHLQTGDMRRIPFEDEAFDYVYEHYALCHLSKRDTVLAVGEMLRVLKREGLCFFGVISADSWPGSIFGQERQPGEYWREEEGGELTLHSAFSDEEAAGLAAPWGIISKEKRVRYLHPMAERMPLEAWMALYEKEGGGHSREDWRARYPDRVKPVQYAHLYYFVRKP